MFPVSLRRYSTREKLICTTELSFQEGDRIPAVVCLHGIDLKLVVTFSKSVGVQTGCFTSSSHWEKFTSAGRVCVRC